MPAMLLRLVAFIALALMVALPAGAQPVTSDRDQAFVRLNIIDLLTNEPKLPLPVRQRREALLSFYEGGRLLFVIGGQAAEGLASRLEGAEIDGLRASDYPVRQLRALGDAIKVSDKRGLAVIELHFAAAFLEYASDLRVGRFLPAKIDPNFFLAAKSIDPLAALNGLAAAKNIEAFFESWQPEAADYRSLRAALVAYRLIAANGGWPSVPFGPTLKPGMRDPRVAALRARLMVTDGAVAATTVTDADLYDDRLKAAVERFQARHGLEVDGAVGPASFGALNVPVAERIASIELAMERWRWMPDALGTQYVMVNIAGFELRRVNRGKVEERMRVVVGKPYSRTPVFSDEIDYVEFNPYWNVPTSILINEELPKLRANPGALAASGFEAVRGKQAYDVRSIDWSQYGPGNMPYRLRQRPGDNNALGQVKMMFPNSHDVYLHDSPARSLFSRVERAFSHGCIRLARPLDMAEQVLRAGGVSGWNRARIDALVASKERTVVNLQQSLPVHITYLTAWAEGGVANFRADIYEHDKKLIAALDGKSIAW